MADGRPPAPQPPPVVPPASPMQLPAPPTQLIVPPAQTIPPPTQPIQPAPMPQLNWSHFKPEFTGKPDEDAEPHLLRTKDWSPFIPCFPRRGQSPAFLSNISGRGYDMNHKGL